MRINISSWSEEELSIINDNRHNLSYVELAHLLEENGYHRSPEAIRKKIKRIDNSEEIEIITDDEEEDIIIKKVPSSRIRQLLNDSFKELVNLKKEFKIKSKKHILQPKVSSNESIVVAISDTHFGKVVKDGEKVVYNTEIAKERFKKLREKIFEVISYARKGVKIDEIVICLVGDIVDNETIYETQSYHIDSFVVEQVKSATKTIWEFILECRKLVDNVRIIAVKGNHGRCLPGYFEVLTNVGYKKIEDVTLDDLIAQVDIEKNNIVFEPAESIFKYNDDETLYEFTANTKDLPLLQCTFDHKLLLADKTIKTAKEAENIFTKENLFYTPGTICREDQIEVYSDNYLRLLVNLIVDGEIVKYSGKKTRLQWRLSKLHKIEHLKKLLEENKIPYIETKEPTLSTNPVYKICVYGENYALKIYRELNKVKTMPWDFIRFNKKQLEIILDEVSIAEDNKQQFLFSSKQTFDVVSTICLMLGKDISTIKRNTKRNNYKIVISDKLKTVKYTKKKIDNPDKDGKSFCIKTKTGFFITRFNKVSPPFVSGNSSGHEDSNWDNVVYQQLEMLINNYSDKNIGIEVKYGDYNIFEVKGHKGLIRHIAPIQTDTPSARAKYGGWYKKYKYDFMIIGHWHHWGINNYNGIPVFRNGSLPGADDLAERMGVHDEPAQILFGVNNKRVPTYVYVIDFK